jgi:hypothetical protein
MRGEEVTRGTRALVVLLLGLIPALLSGCTGSTKSAASDAGTNCSRATSYLMSCGITRSVQHCEFITADVECESACDLNTSCAYFLGQNPAEGPARAQCGGRCTCEAAKRRATECGVVADFDCAPICNCPYYYGCSDGIPAYIACRAACPPWPEPTDASDNADASAN